MCLRTPISGEFIPAHQVTVISIRSAAKLAGKVFSRGSKAARGVQTPPNPLTVSCCLFLQCARYGLPVCAKHTVAGNGFQRREITARQKSRMGWGKCEAADQERFWVDVGVVLFSSVDV